MSILDIIEGRLPFWKSCSSRRLKPVNLEKDFSKLLVTSSPKYYTEMMQQDECSSHHFIPDPNILLYTDEGRTITVVTGPGSFIILKNESNLREILEVSAQPISDCHMQLFDGTSPMSAVKFVPANALWSAPGKVILNDLFMNVLEGAIVQVEVRHIPVLQRPL